MKNWLLYAFLCWCALGLLAQPSDPNKAVAIVNGETILQKDLDAILQKTYGEAAEALKESVVAAHLQEMIIFKVIEQKMRSITIKCEAKDYEEDADRYAQPFFAYYFESGIKNSIKFLKDLKIIVAKSPALQKKHGDWIKSKESRILTSQDLKPLAEIWQDILSTKELKPMIREKCCTKFYMYYPLFKERIKIITKFRLHIASQLQSSDIARIAEQDKFALSDGMVKVSHLFLSTVDLVTGKPMSPEIEQQVAQRIQQVRSEISPDLSNFSEKTAAYSEHTSTKYQGGNLGWIPRWSASTLLSGFLLHLGWGPLPTDSLPEVVEASYRLSEKTLSQPIKTVWGYHLLVITELKPSKDLPPDELLKNAKNMLVLLKMEQALRTWLEQSEIKQFK